MTAPIRWRGKDWAIFGAVIAGTALISSVDEPVNDYFVRHQSKTADRLADLGSEFGEPRTAVVLTASLYTIGAIAGDEWLRDTCVILTASLLPAGGIQTTTKTVFGRARPHVGLGNREFDFFSRNEKYHSFFSGHTMSAMAISHVFARRSNSAYVKVACYAMGGLCGFSRLNNSSHWLSDVALGGALAVFSVDGIINWYDGKNHDNHNGMVGVLWRLIPTPRAVHLSVSW